MLSAVHASAMTCMLMHATRAPSWAPAAEGRARDAASAGRGRACAAQVYKAFLARCGKFVAIKKINCFERVRAARPSWPVLLYKELCMPL